MGVYEKKDYTKAIEFYNKAFKQNFSEAMCKLGDCYFYGLGVEKDYEKAKNYYMDAEKMNNKNAYCQLGIMYMMGKGVKKDYEKAKEYIYKAAKLINLTAIKIKKKCFENVSEKELYEMLDRRKLVKKNRERKFEREEIKTGSYVYNFYSQRIYDADDFGMIVINDIYCDEWEETFGEKDFIVDFGVGWFTGGLGGACGPGYVETYIRNIVQVKGIDYFGDEIFATLTFKVPKEIR